MQKGKWKFFTVIILLFALVVTGCSSATTSESGTTENASTESSTTESAATEETKEPVTIKFHNWYFLENDNFNKVIAAFEEKHPNIKVEFVSAEDSNATEYLKRLDLSAASGEDLDVILFPNTGSLIQRLELGMVEPLDPFLEKEGIKLTEEYTVDTTIDGKVYVLPGNVTIPFIVINSNHLQEAGLEVPKKWTWDEYMAYAKAMTKTENGKTRYGTYFHTWGLYKYYIQHSQPTTGSHLASDDGKKANVYTILNRKWLELRLQGEKEKSATPYSEIVSQKLNYRPQYFNQEASMIPISTFLIPETGGTEKVPVNFKSTFAPVPTVNPDDPITGNVSYVGYGVYSKSKHKDEAYTFVRYLTTEGLVLQGKYFPAWAKADNSAVIDTIIGNTKTPENVDKEALLYVLQNTIFTNAPQPTPFNAELEKVYIEEFDKLMLSGQDIETTLLNAQKKVQEIIDSKQ
jgi:multiple sugar transport system substrate-binding protein